MLGKTRRVHFVGIGGIGMSGIAELLANLGFEVSGSDVKRSEVTARLERVAGVRVHEGHAAGNVGSADVVVVSSAVKPTNPEVLEAERQGIPVVPRAEMLAELAASATPAVLVPLPTATDDHQRKNADVVAKAGAAVVIEERELGATLPEVLKNLLGDRARLQAMSAAARTLARPDAAQRIADRVEQLAPRLRSGRG